MVDFSDSGDVRNWLDGISPSSRRREAAISIAARAALRVLPLTESVIRGKVPGLLAAIVLPVLRAAALTWVAARYSTYSSEFREAARSAVTGSADAGEAAAASAAAYDDSASAAAYAASAAASAANAAHMTSAAAAATSAAACSHESSFAASAYVGSSESFDAAGDATSADAAWIDGGRSPSEIAAAPLWLDGAPVWADEAWQRLRAALLQENEDWRVWTDWYDARMLGDMNWPANLKLEIDRALIDDSIWNKGPRAVNAEIARLIKLHSQAPEPELGSTMDVRDGYLTLTNIIASGRFDNRTQSELHRRLRALSSKLAHEGNKIGNTHRELASIIGEYARLIAEPTDQLNITALFAVGAGVIANAEILARPPQVGAFVPPLEPDYLALLKQLAMIHGAFITGFELGQSLTDRADRARTSEVAITSTIPVAHELLQRLGRANAFVENRTRHFFVALSHMALEPSWQIARVGYAVYAFTRDTLIALGKATLLSDNAAASSLVGGIAINALDPELANQIHLISLFLLDNARTILSFSEPFPELKFWLTEILAALKKDYDYRL